MKRQESIEDYLETILLLEQKNGTVRSIDIAHELDYSKPSISRAMSKLRESGDITMESNGRIQLTALGRERAEKVYSRHKLLVDCLLALGVPPDLARRDGCRIEHDISDETYDKINQYYHEQLEKRESMPQHEDTDRS